MDFIQRITYMDRTLNDIELIRSTSDDSIEIEEGTTVTDLYRVISGPLPDGSMGNVFRVYHTGWNIDLAMKQPKPELFQTERQKENFIRECEVWINLGLHPHIVSCYYVREINGILSIFAEWMDGGNLKEAIDNESLYEGPDEIVLKRILDIAIQFAGGLYYAHTHGNEQDNEFVHRDVKPANLLLSKDGNAKVTDFGISAARAVLSMKNDKFLSEGQTQISEKGVYTPAYCSIEQEEGEKLTIRTDIWSWAVSVLEMFTGERPWNSGVAAGVACEEYFRMARIIIPEAMRNLLRYCFKVNETERPKDFREIEHILLEIYRDEAGSDYLHEESKAAVITIDSLNNHALSFLDLNKPEEAEECWEHALALNAVHIDAVFNNAIHLWRNAKTDDTEVEKKIKKLCDNRAQDDRITYLSAQFYAEQGNYEHAINILHSIDHIDKFPEAKHLLTDMEGQPVLNTWYFDENEIDQIWINAAQKTAVSLTEDKNIIIWNIEQEKSVCIWKYTGNARSACISHDWKYLAVISRHSESVYLIKLKDNRSIIELEGLTGGVANACISPDGNHILTSSWYGLIKLWDVATSECVGIWECGFYVSNVCFSPDGQNVLIAGDDVIKLFNAYSGEYLREFECMGIKSINSVCISPNGMYALSGEGSRSKEYSQLMRLWDMSTGKSLRVYPDSGCDVGFLNNGMYAFSKNNGIINHSVKLWDLLTGQCIKTFTNGKSFYILGSEQYVQLLQNSDNERISVRPVLIPSYKSKWSLSRIIVADQQLVIEKQIRQIEQSIKNCLEKKDIRKALDLYDELRQIPGFSNSGQFITLNRELASHCDISGVHSCRQIKTGQVIDFSGGLNCFSDDGKFLYIQKTVWDTNSHLKITSLSIPSDKECFKDVCFLPGGKEMLTVEPSPKQTFSLSSYHELFQLWDLVSGNSVPVIQACMERVNTISISPDGKYALLGYRMIYLVEIQTGSCKSSISLNVSATKVLFHPDGIMILVITGSDVSLWDIHQEKMIWQKEIDILVTDARFSSDGKSLMMFNSDRKLSGKPTTGAILLWDPETGNQINELIDNHNEISDAVFCQGGKHVLSFGARKHQLKFWNIESGMCIFSHDTGSEVLLPPTGNYAVTETGFVIFNYNFEFPG